MPTSSKAREARKRRRTSGGGLSRPFVGAGDERGFQREDSRLLGFHFRHFETVPAIGADHGKEQVRVRAGIRDGRHLPAALLGGGAAGWQEFPSVSDWGSGPRGRPTLPGSRAQWRGHRGNAAANERAALSIILGAGYDRFGRELVWC